jgi:hypothetical protein
LIQLADEVSGGRVVEPDELSRPVTRTSLPPGPNEAEVTALSHGIVATSPPPSRQILAARPPEIIRVPVGSNLAL